MLPLRMGEIDTIASFEIEDLSGPDGTPVPGPYHYGVVTARHFDSAACGHLGGRIVGMQVNRDMPNNMRFIVVVGDRVCAMVPGNSGVNSDLEPYFYTHDSYVRETLAGAVVPPNTCAGPDRKPDGTVCMCLDCRFVRYTLARLVSPDTKYAEAVAEEIKEPAVPPGPVRAPGTEEDDTDTVE